MVHNKLFIFNISVGLNIHFGPSVFEISEVTTNADISPMAQRGPERLGDYTLMIIRTCTQLNT